MTFPKQLRKTRVTEFFTSEVMHYFDTVKQCTEVDREGLIPLLKLLYNGQVPGEEYISKFFRSGSGFVDKDTVIDVILNQIPLFDSTIRPNAIFPAEQAKIAPFRAPVLSTARYHNLSVAQIKSGHVKRYHKSFFGQSYPLRCYDLTPETLTIYEKVTKDKVSIEIFLKDITKIEAMPNDKNVYPFCISGDNFEIILATDDDNSRKYWFESLASLILLKYASSNIINEERFKYMVSIGGNLNSCYSREDPRPILYHLLLHKQMKLAKWVLDQGAQPSCLLRWQFVVRDHILSPNEILTLMEEHHIPLSLKSDDNFNYHIMHYMCYFGDVEGVRKLAQSMESQSLINDPTEGNEIALTIALLSPETSVETKEQIALLLYESSNISLCNKAMQNPVQLAMLMGKTELLLRMLCITNNARYDAFGNSYLHLAIKAGLPTIARFIFRFTSTGDLNKKDCAGDTVLTLAIKSGDEELAVSILGGDNVDPSISCSNWGMPNSEHDLVVHQALKRRMPYLANAILDSGEFFLQRDTEGNLPIHLALVHHLDVSVDYVLNNGPVEEYINAPNGSDADTPLHLALKLGYKDECITILARGANVNAVNDQGLTPIHVLVKAAMGEYSTQATQVLSPEQYRSLLYEILQRGPELKAQCKENGVIHKETAFHMAIRGCPATEDLAMMMLQSDRELVHTRDYENCTPLIRAVEVHSLHLVQALVSNAADLAVVDPHGNTPLHLAVASDDQEIVTFLVSHGAFIRLWNAEGYFPIHLAIRNRDLQSLSLLCHTVIDSNLQTANGETCFMLACAMGSFECALFLLEASADPYLLDRQNRSCLHVVAELVRKDPAGHYYELAFLVCGLLDMLEMECFPLVEQTRRDAMELQEYLRAAIEAGQFDERKVKVTIPEMLYMRNNETIQVNYPQVESMEQPLPFDRRQSFMPVPRVDRNSNLLSPPQSPSMFAANAMVVDPLMMEERESELGRGEPQATVMDEEVRSGLVCERE